MFFHLHWDAFWWKYFVFLSPSVNHLISARCFHISSSFSSHVWTSLLAARWAWKYLRKRLDSSRLSRFYWAILSFQLTFPKVVLFHWINFIPHYFSSSGIFWLSTLGGCRDHTDLITFKHASFLTHIYSNRMHVYFHAVHALFYLRWDDWKCNNSFNKNKLE